MMIWLLEREDPIEYDTYLSAVVVAPTEEAARLTHPGGQLDMRWDPLLKGWYYSSGGDYPDSSWLPPDEVIVTLLGIATGENVVSQVVCAAFNAG